MRPEPARALGLLFLALAAVTMLPGVVWADEEGGETVVVFGGTLVDGLGGAPIPRTTLVVRGGRIAAIRPQEDGLPVGEANRLVDARGRFVVPGFVAAGAHFLANGTCGAVPWRADHTLRALRVSLAEGVTTAASLGEPVEAIALLSDASADRAPRLLSTGPIFAAPGGYPGGAYAALAERRPPEEVTAADEARAAVARLADEGAAAVWIAADDRSLDQTPLAELPLATFTALVDEARARGLRSFARVQYAADWRAALRAGADVLVGASLDRLDGDTIAALSRRGTIVVSALAPYEALAAARPSPARGASVRLGPEGRRRLDAWLREFGGEDRIAVEGIEVSRRRMARSVLEGVRNLRRLRAAGVRVALAGGGGACLVLHGAPRAEAALLARAGYTPGEILRAATYEGAAALGIDGRVGSLEVGKRADLALLGRDPTRSVEALGAVEKVLAAGRPVDPAALAAAPGRWERAWLRIRLEVVALGQGL